MKIIISIIAGLLWGFLGAMINYLVMKKAVSAGNAGKVTAVTALRTLIDALFLGLVFCVRNLGFINFAVAITSTAAALSITTIVTTFMLAKPEASAENKE